MYTIHLNSGAILKIIKRPEILPSGWLRVVFQDDSAVYFPPHRIHEMRYTLVSGGKGCETSPEGYTRTERITS